MCARTVRYHPRDRSVCVVCSLLCSPVLYVRCFLVLGKTKRVSVQSAQRRDCMTTPRGRRRRGTLTSAAPTDWNVHVLCLQRHTSFMALDVSMNINNEKSEIAHIEQG